MIKALLLILGLVGGCVVALDVPNGDQADKARVSRTQAALRKFGSLKAPPKYVTALSQNRDGAVWVATEGNGLWRYNPSAAAD